ncbi:MAG: sulfurtransferase [Gammaproteobacteria bacterium]
MSTHDLLARLNQPWVQLIDVRSTEEYAGRDIRALRGGHIPGARNLPLGDTHDPDAIAALLAPHLDSLDPRKETIVYGQVDADAAPLAAWLQAQGFRHVRLYKGAWQAWGNRLELPASDERFADVNALRERITALEQALDRLSPARLAGR